ncbi:DUF1622 domain-containing protein [Leptolyngbya sp. AN03gr2]|uniref:DUF1622 domain-containing protein n=1 Tax=unclassified Leptolyngbya TaxID=2650499 RepID=UPI003D3186CF
MNWEKRKSAPDSIANLLLPLSLILGLVLLLSLSAGQGSVQENTPLETWLKVIVDYLAAAAEIAAAIVIGVAVVRGILNYARQLFSRRHHIDSTESIRLQLGRVLALGLEFTVASDILRTVIAPTRQDIVNLGALVLLRTLLNYFLEREIQQVEQSRMAEQTPQPRM